MGELDKIDSMDTEVIEVPKLYDLSTTVFIGGVPTDFSESQLRQLCSEFGDVIDCHLSVNPVTEKHRGFGYITMLTLEQALAVTQLNGREVNGSKLVVEYSEQ